MARNNDSQPSRIYKASDVHKRRVNRKARPEEAPEQRTGKPVFPADSWEPELELSPVASEGEPKPAAEPVESVVLKPEFGRRTEQQREADDRWFAAMREAVPEVIPASSKAPDGQVPAEPQSITPDNAGDLVPVRADVNASASMGANAGGATLAGASSNPPTEQDDAPNNDETQNGPSAQPAEEPPSASSADSPDADPGANADANAEASEPPARFGAKAAGAFAAREKLSVKRRIVLALTVVIVAAIAVAVALFTWNRWYRFDDHADMQGEWYVVGTTVPVSIDESTIHLTDDVTYQYEINTQGKTIHYSFGPMEGRGRYWFSDDRQYLVITDGDEFTSTGTAFDDLLHSFGDLADKATGSDIKLPEGEGVIAFSREPDAQAVEREQREAAKKAAEEEAARKEAERIAAEEAAAEAAAWEEYYYEEEYYEEESPAEEQEQPSEDEHQEA